jgi:hypothetical protein
MQEVYSTDLVWSVKIEEQKLQSRSIRRSKEFLTAMGQESPVKLRCDGGSMSLLQCF